jgi:hypothetical protein
MPGPFERVTVDHLVRGRTRVTWRLSAPFCDPDPWESRLQWGHTGNPAADDWEDVAPYAPDAGTLVDVTPRDDDGISWRVHYRVQLRTPAGEYTSDPARILLPMGEKLWLRARAITRREMLRMDKADAARGWLFKRKREGVVPDVTRPRTAVTSFLTGEVVRSQAAVSVGTEFVGGFYAPVPFRVDFNPAGTREERDGVKVRGTVDDRATMQRGHVVLDPPVADGDVFVAEGSDERFVIHEVDYGAIVGRTPLVADASFRLAPRSDVIYRLAVPDVDPFPAEAYCG